MEHKKKYFLYALGILLVGVIVFFLSILDAGIYAEYDTINLETGKIIYENSISRWGLQQNIWYWGGLILFGGIFACTSFVNFNNKGESILYLIKPASQLEKWLTEIIIHIFLFFIVYTCLFYIIHLPFTFFVRSLEYQRFLEEQLTWNEIEKATRVFSPTEFFFFVNNIQDNLIVPIFLTSLYISVVAYFMYGAILFNRFSFFKSLIMAFLIGICYFFYALLLDSRQLFFPYGWRWYGLKATKNLGMEDLEVVLPEYWTWIIISFLLLFVPCIFLISSYQKLKEKEV